MKTLGQPKKKPSVLANTIKKKPLNENISNTSANKSKSFANRSTSSGYVSELRRNNAKLARALTSQKVMCMSLFNRLNAKESQELQQQAIMRGMKEKFKDCCSKYRNLSDTVITGFLDLSSMLTSVSSDIEALFSEGQSRNSSLPVSPTAKESKRVGNTQTEHVEENTQRRYTVRPMVQGQVISNPSVSLERVSIPIKHTRTEELHSTQQGTEAGSEMSDSAAASRLSPLPEESFTDTSSATKSSEKLPASHNVYRNPKPKAVIQLPSSCVMLERLQHMHNISADSENTPKLADEEAVSDSFGRFGSPEDIAENSIRKTHDQNKKIEEDPQEGTSQDFIDCWDFDSSPEKKKKNRTQTKKRDAGITSGKSSHCVPTTSSSRQSADDFCTTITDEVDMSFTACVDPKMFTSNSSNCNEKIGEQCSQMSIPVIQIEKVDSIKLSRERQSSSKSVLFGSDMPSNVEREVYVTQRVRKDQSQALHSSRKKKEEMPMQENSENTPPKKHVHPVKKALQKGAPENSPETSKKLLHHDASYVALERLSNFTCDLERKEEKDPPCSSAKKRQRGKSLQSTERRKKSSKSHQDGASSSEEGLSAPSLLCGTVAQPSAHSSDSESSTCSESVALGRRAKTLVSYKEPALNKKMRRQ